MIANSSRSDNTSTEVGRPVARQIAALAARWTAFLRLDADRRPGPDGSRSPVAPGAPRRV